MVETKERKPEPGDILIYPKDFDRFVIDEKGNSIPVKTDVEAKILSLLLEIKNKLEEKR